MFGDLGFTQGRTASSTISDAHTDTSEDILIGDELELHDACRRGDLELAQALIKSGVDVNCRNKHDRTPLHWASGNGHVHVCRYLIDDCAAAIDVSDKFGMDALLWAAWFGHKNSTKFMLKVGMKATARNKHGYSWLHCATQNDHLSLLDVLEEELQDFDRNIVDNCGRTCVHVACKFKRSEMLELLLKKGCNPNKKDKEGNTAMHTAAQYGFVEAIEILAKSGCSIEEFNNQHQSPLHIAAQHGQMELCESILLQGGDVNIEDNEETCPLHLAVNNLHLDATKLLISHKADVDACNKHNQTPLHFAVARKNVDVTKLLLDCRANTSVQDARGETVLHLAAENGLVHLTELFLRAKPKLNVCDQKGKTPLEVAARGNYVTIVDMIIKAERLAGLYDARADVEPGRVSFLPDWSQETEHFRSILFNLASKHMKAIEWKQLAYHWAFTDKQLAAIEEQYTGSKSWREHGHRMLLIWLHGCLTTHVNPMKSLYAGLVFIQRRDLAESTRNKASKRNEHNSCSMS